MVTDFLYATELLTRLVDGNYSVFLLRQADPTGEQVWIGQLQQGLSFLTIAEGFLASDEFFTRAAANR